VRSVILEPNKTHKPQNEALTFLNPILTEEKTESMGLKPKKRPTIKMRNKIKLGDAFGESKQFLKFHGGIQNAGTHNWGTQQTTYPHLTGIQGLSH
jgi:hypothetical protein